MKLLFDNEGRREKMYFNLKLKETINADGALRRLTGIAGIANIARMFPDETDPETASLYRVELNDDVCSVAEHQIFMKIRDDPDVEFVERPAPRKLCS